MLREVPMLLSFHSGPCVPISPQLSTKSGKKSPSEREQVPFIPTQGPFSVNLLTSWEEICTFRGPARHWIATSKRPNLPRYERNSSHEVSKCTCKLTKKSLFCSRLEKKLFAWLLSLLSSKTECDSRHNFIPLPLRGRTRQLGTA